MNMLRLSSLIAALGLLFASPSLANNCGNYPFTLTNGSTADANQVMANFNSILGCTNTNLAHNGTNNDITSATALTSAPNLVTLGAGAAVTNLGFTPVNKAGDTMSGSLGVVGSLTIDGTAGSSRTLAYTTSGSSRWQWVTTSTAESGSNVGSDMGLNAFSDAGSFLSTPILIKRSTGLVTVQTALQSNGDSALNGGIHISNTVVSGDRFIDFQTSGSNRWLELISATAESGGNVGSDFGVNRYSDAGSFLDTPFLITRSTGVVSMPDGVVANVTGNLTGTASAATSAASATALANARTISITGDMSYTSGGFNGTANVTGTGTLTAIGGGGSCTLCSITIDTKGRVTAASSGTPTTVAEFTEQETSGSNSSLGGFSATSWTGEPINNTVGNNISGASLTTNTITLPAGTYQLKGWCVARSATGVQIVCRIRTSAGGVYLGPALAAASGTLNVAAPVTATFSIGTSTQFVLEVWVGTGVSPAGGFATGTGSPETYSGLQVEKVS